MDGIDTNFFRPGLRVSLGANGELGGESGGESSAEWQRAMGRVSHGSFQLEDWIPEIYFEMSEDADEMNPIHQHR